MKLRSVVVVYTSIGNEKFSSEFPGEVFSAQANSNGDLTVVRGNSGDPFGINHPFVIFAQGTWNRVDIGFEEEQK